MKTARHPFLSICLASLLLIAQLGAFAHALEHRASQDGHPLLDAVSIGQPAQDGQEIPGEIASCLTCIGYANIGAVACSEAPSISAETEHLTALLGDFAVIYVSSHPNQHRARAPPDFS